MAVIATCLFIQSCGLDGNPFDEQSSNYIPDSTLRTHATPDSVFVTDTLLVNDTTLLTDTLRITDTLIINDTTLLTDTLTIHDTTLFTDTLRIIDTLQTTDTITVTDTLQITDTLTIRDTTLITDTLRITDTLTINDTTVLTDTLTITDTLTVHDTTIVNDTIHAPPLSPTIYYVNLIQYDDYVTLEVAYYMEECTMFELEFSSDGWKNRETYQIPSTNESAHKKVTFDRPPDGEEKYVYRGRCTVPVTSFWTNSSGITLGKE
jgi:hypothetical protein